MVLKNNNLLLRCQHNDSLDYYCVYLIINTGSPEENQKSSHSNTATSASSLQGYHGNMHPASMVAMQTSFNPNLLMKPVPMRGRHGESQKRSHSHRDMQHQMPLEPPMCE